MVKNQVNTVGACAVWELPHELQISWSNQHLTASIHGKRCLLGGPAQSKAEIRMKKVTLHFSGASGSRSMTYFPRATLMIGAPGILLIWILEPYFHIVFCEPTEFVS